MATSGTVSTYSFPQRKILDHAFRRAGLMPESVSSEQLEIAQDLIYTLTSEWVSAGVPLWTRSFGLYGTQIGSPEVQTPNGTLEVILAYWRILNPYRGNAIGTDNSDISVLFGGQPNTDVTITGVNPGVVVNFGSPTELDTIGVLLGNQSPVTAALQLSISPDGFTYTPFQTLPSATYSAGQWVYFDLDPSITSQYVQLTLPGATSWTLNQVNFGLANGQDILLGDLSMDNYYNLPNRLFRSDRPNSIYVDRQLNTPVMRIWPTPDVGAFYNGTVSAVTRRYIQDPGSLTNEIEMPQRWSEALIWRLATRLIYELPMDVDSQASSMMLQARAARQQTCEQQAEKSESLAWAEERSGGPMQWLPMINGYTR